MRIFNIKNILGVGQSVSMSGNKVTVNGQTFDVPGGNVSIINGKIIANGKEIKGEDIGLKDNYQFVDIKIEGNVDRIDCAGSVEVKGDVHKGVDCGGSARITGNVDGDIDAGGSVTISGAHKGSIDAGGSVSIR